LKTALVTGAAQGVGFAAAALLGRLGYGVVLLDVKPIDARVRQLQDAGTQAVGVVGDVAAEPFVRELAGRVARDYGARSIAAGALGQLSEMLAENGPFDPGEPFLAPGKRFDTIAPRADLKDWLRASALEELERISSFSSFFTGETSLKRLETITSLGYGSEEMSRRLQLVRIRFPKPA